jgi:hypothetical protein
MLSRVFPSFVLLLRGMSREGLIRHSSCKMGGSETWPSAVVLHLSNNPMKPTHDLKPADKAQAAILTAQLKAIEIHFAHDLDSMIDLTFAQYGVDPTHPRVNHVLDPLRDVMRSRLETRDGLYRQSLRTQSDEASAAIRKQLEYSPRAVATAYLQTLQAKGLDLDDPLVLAAFNAAGKILAYFLRHEDDQWKQRFEAIDMHLRLQSERRSERT